MLAAANYLLATKRGCFLGRYEALSLSADVVTRSKASLLEPIVDYIVQFHQMI